MALFGWDRGYGPARYLTAPQVKEIAAALAPISTETLRDRYDPATLEAMALYPHGDWAPPDCLPAVLHAFMELQQFNTQAAVAGDGMLLLLD